jgi:hypothetical protein
VVNPVQFLTHTFSGVEGTRTAGAVTDSPGRLNDLLSMYNEQAEIQDRKMEERLKGEAYGVLYAVRRLSLLSRISADMAVIE